MSDNYETRSNWVNRSASCKVLKTSLSHHSRSRSRSRHRFRIKRLELVLVSMFPVLAVTRCLSFCLSHSCVVSKRLNILSEFFHHLYMVFDNSDRVTWYLIKCVVFIEPPCTLFKVVEVHDMTPMRKRKVVEYRYHLLQVKSDDDASGSSAVNLDSVSDSSPAFLHAGHLVQLDSFLSTHGPCGRLFGLYLITCASLVTWHLFCREVHVLFKLWSLLRTLLFYFECSLTVIIMKFI